MNSSTEQDYAELKRLGVKLHIPVPEMFWDFKIEKMEDNKIIHSHSERGHSWVRNAYNLLFATMIPINANTDGVFGAGKINVKIADGSYAGSTTTSATTIGTTGQYSGSNVEVAGSGLLANEGDVSKGIIVGTDNTPFSFEQYNIIGKILHGESIGKLVYKPVTLSNKSYDPGSKTYSVTFTRTFNNPTNSSISIKEVGLYEIIHHGGDHPVMIVRDVLEAPVVVPPMSIVTVNYTLTLTFPI